MYEWNGRLAKHLCKRVKWIRSHYIKSKRPIIGRKNFQSSLKSISKFRLILVNRLRLNRLEIPYELLCLGEIFLRPYLMHKIPPPQLSFNELKKSLRLFRFLNFQYTRRQELSIIKIKLCQEFDLFSTSLVNVNFWAKTSQKHRIQFHDTLQSKFVVALIQREFSFKTR